MANKAKKLYGVSSKFDFGKWSHRVYVFKSHEEAESLRVKKQ